jgi:trimeric autotransporter adhesin
VIRLRASARIVQFAFLATLFFGSQTSTQAQTSIFENLINDPNPSTANPFTSGQTVNPNITVSGIGRGTGINAADAANRYNASGWSLGTTLDVNDYFEWTLIPNNGFEIDFTSLAYIGRRSGTGPRNFAFRSSIDGFSQDIGVLDPINVTTETAVNIDLSQFVNITTSISFRLYGFNATGAGGTFSINEFTFNGSVNGLSGVPEPATVLLICAGATGLVHIRRRRKDQPEQLIAA